MTTVVCLKVGTKYSAEYVNRLKNQVAKNTTVPYKFLCITDDSSGVNADCIAPITDLPGWWAKLSLFSQRAYGIQDKILYIDLDTIVVGNLDEMLEYQSHFCILRDFVYPNTYGSGVFILKPGFVPHVWARFRPEFIPSLRRGDQEWILRQCPELPTWPEKWCVSYKLHAKTSVPPEAKLVCFHGPPKPSEVPAGSWLDNYWRVPV